MRVISILILLTYTCKAQTIVELKYSEDIKSVRSFTLPLEDGKYLLRKVTQAVPDAEGIIRLQINLKKPGILYAFTPLGQLEIYLEPNKQVHVDIGTTVSFSGDLKTENILLDKFRRTRSKKGFYPIEVALYKTESVEAFSDTLNHRIDAELKLLDKSASESKRPSVRIDGELKFQEKSGSGLKRPSSELIDLIARTYNCFIIAKPPIFCLLKSSRLKREGQEDPIRKEDLDSLHKSLLRPSMVNYNLSSSLWYAEYLDQYMGFLWSTNGGPWTDNAESTQRMAKITDQNLSGVSKEVYSSFFISRCMLMGPIHFDQDLVNFYNQFKTEFPNSTFVPMLEPRMQGSHPIRV